MRSPRSVPAPSARSRSPSPDRYERTPVPTIAIVGAGPGVGLAIARIFGSRGFAVALVARNRDKLDGLVTQLAAEGVSAAAFQAIK